MCSVETPLTAAQETPASICCATWPALVLLWASLFSLRTAGVIQTILFHDSWFQAADILDQNHRVLGWKEWAPVLTLRPLVAAFGGAALKSNTQSSLLGEAGRLELWFLKSN